MVVKNSDTKSSPSLIDLLGGGTKSKTVKTTDTFAQLLASLNTQNAPLKEEKTFGIVVDPKTQPKTPKINEMVKLNTKVDEPLTAEETKTFPKEIVSVLSNDQVRTLIQKAKEYLKNEITAKAPEYQIDVKTLPKTLMGLVEVANKIGIDMSSISLSTLDDATKALSKDIPDVLLSKNLFELKEAPKTQTSSTPKTVEIMTQLFTQSKGIQIETKSAKGDEKTVQQPLQSLLKELTKSLDPSSKIPTIQPQPTAVAQTTVAQTATTPMVQPQPTAVAQTIAIPIVAPKNTVQEVSTTTASSGNNLESLLQGKDEKTVVEKSKEDNVTSEDSSKFVRVHQEGSIEVKSKETLQSLSHFATDLKEAADNYKPPFTRITMKLNPEKLGEVEVTLVQRGNNIHVNIQSSNANSVTFLAHNALELKTQLAQQGVSNATMNFMSGGENQSQNSNSQQHHQQQQNRFQAYASLKELESAQKELSALEIILPHYA